MSDTIAAIATGSQVAAIGIVRLSGPDSIRLMDILFRPLSGKPMSQSPDRSLVYGKLYSGAGELLDLCLCTISRGPRSYTGEDTAELQCHGSPVVLRAVLDELFKLGARHAQPGEFTKRAFLNGRMELTAAEAVADIIDAESIDYAKNAAGQLSGAMERKIEGIYSALADISSHYHAVLDYPDEDIEDFRLENYRAQLDSALATRNSTLAQLEAGMQSAKANVEQLSSVLENVDGQGNVVAPISGTLVSLSAVENGMVSPSMPVAVIDGVDQLKITVTVSEALVPKLKIGDAVDVTVSSVGAAFTGAIRSVDKAASLQTKLYTVTVSIPAEEEGLLSGMFADVTFHTETSADTIVIPTQAILTSGSTQYVYVVEGDTARYVEVTTGLTGNGVTEITSGLEAGQQLVTVGQAYLSDGALVRIVTGEG